MSDEFHFEFEFEVDPAQRAAVEAALRRALDDVDAAEKDVMAPTRIGVMEVAGFIGVGVLILNNSAQALDALRRLVKAFKELRAEVQGVKDARIKVGEEEVALAEATDEQLQAAVEAARG